jgi:hypothetical protein
VRARAAFTVLTTVESKKAGGNRNLGSAYYLVMTMERLDEHQERPPQAYAHLTILSSTLTTEALTDLAGIPPSETWRRGDIASDLPEESRFRKYEKSGIQFASRAEATETGEAHLHDLLTFIGEHEQELRELIEHPEVDSAEVDVWSCSPNGAQSFYIGASEIALLARSGLSLWIDSVWAGDEEKHQ